MLNGLVECWTACVTIVALAVLPALALGRARGRTTWWPELLAGTAWSMLATIGAVPVLGAMHLFNWATALLVPLGWPLALWLYRYRGAPWAEFRMLCRRLTLRVLTGRPRAANLWRRSMWRQVLGGALAVLA